MKVRFVLGKQITFGKWQSDEDIKISEPEYQDVTESVQTSTKVIQYSPKNTLKKVDDKKYDKVFIFIFELDYNFGENDGTTVY